MEKGSGMRFCEGYECRREKKRRRLGKSTPENVGRAARVMELIECRSNRENDGKGRTSMNLSDADGGWTFLKEGLTCKTVNGETRAAFSMINPVQKSAQQILRFFLSEFRFSDAP